MMYKILYNLVPNYLLEICPVRVSNRSIYSLRSSDDQLSVPFAQTERFKKSFIVPSTNLWNNLPSDVRFSNSLTSF